MGIIKNKILLSLIFFFLFSCSHSYIRSGKYVLFRDGDSIESLVKEFNIPYDSIFNANKNAKWQKGEWVFIPQNYGILPKLMGSAFSEGLYSNANYYDGYFLWPTPASNRITSVYGEDRQNHIHDGIDVGAPMGSYVVASEDGEVSISTNDPDGYGEVLMVSHDNGIATLYGHLSKKLVKQGERVKRGQIIALVGSTGRSSGPHLHFEVRRSGKTTDPGQFFNSK
ncbi:MAG: M23 family metallopeptidase [Oligoflexia bacterium]|nr:M23 family metallopeptidase [Oligoflexia bacterium]